MRRIWLGAVAVFVAAAALAQIVSKPAPEGALAYIISPAAGARLTSPVTVRFGLRSLGVAPAGIDRVGTGHHHLLVDLATLPPTGQPIVADASHLHFGAGQTEASIELEAGRHTLQMMVGDYLHVPHDPPIVSARIEIVVVDE